MDLEDQQNIYCKCHQLMDNYDSYKRIKLKERKTHQFKGCQSFRYRIKCISKKDETYIFKSGYYYTNATGSIFGALYHASVGKYWGLSMHFVRAEIYQYINRHQINASNILYKSFSNIYENGLYYNLIRSDTTTNFQLEMIAYLEKGIKRFPEMI